MLNHRFVDHVLLRRLEDAAGLRIKDLLFQIRVNHQGTADRGDDFYALQLAGAGLELLEQHVDLPMVGDQHPDRIRFAAKQILGRLYEFHIRASPCLKNPHSSGDG